MKRGKKYIEAAKHDRKRKSLRESRSSCISEKSAVAKFDETIEAHIRTGCDGRHADQQIRGAVVLPHGTGNRFVSLFSLKAQKLMRLLQQVQSSLELRS